MLTQQDLQQIAKLLDQRFTQYDKKMEKRFIKVDKRFEQVDKRFEQVDKRFEQVDKRFEQVDKRFDTIEAEVKSIKTDLEEVIEQNIMPVLQTIMKDVENNKEAIKKLQTTLEVHYPTKYDVQDMIGDVRGPIIKLLKMLDGKIDLLVDLLKEEKIISPKAYHKITKLQIMNPIPREKLLEMS